MDAIGFVYKDQPAAEKSWGSWRLHHPGAIGVAILDLGGDIRLDPNLNVRLRESDSKISCSKGGLYLDLKSVPLFMTLVGEAANALSSKSVLIMEDDVRILGNLDHLTSHPRGMIGVNRRVRLPLKLVIRLVKLGFRRALVPGYGGCGGAVVSRDILSGFSNQSFQFAMLDLIQGVKEIWGSDEIISIGVLASNGQILENGQFTETWRRNWASRQALIVHKVKTAGHEELLGGKKGRIR